MADYSTYHCMGNKPAWEPNVGWAFKAVGEWSARCGSQSQAPVDLICWLRRCLLRWHYSCLVQTIFLSL